MLVLTAVYHTIDLTMCVSLPRKFRHSVTRLGINHISCLICSIWSLVGDLNCCLLPIMPHTCPDWRIWSPWQNSNKCGQYVAGRYFAITEGKGML